MGYGRALLMRDVGIEEEAFQKKAKKKSLWGSIGRTLGGLGAMAITGGIVNPLTVGLISGGASFLGGAAGAKLSKTGDLSKGRFFKSDRESAQKELGAFGTQNLVSSLRSGLTAGIGQAAKLYKAGSKAQEAGKSAAEVSKIRKGVGFKEGFGESFAGKGWDKYVTQPREAKALSKAVKTAGEEARLAEHLQTRGDFASEFGLDGGNVSQRMKNRMLRSTSPTTDVKGASLDDFLTNKANFSSEFGIDGMDPLWPQRMRVATDVPEFSTQMPSDSTFEFGQQGGRTTGGIWQRPAYSQGTFYNKQFRHGHPMIDKYGRLKNGMSTVIEGK